MLHLYGWSSRVYTNLFKVNKKAWGISKAQFSNYPKESLGYALGIFYEHNGFDVMPKLENHDVFHVLTETGTLIQDEIAMQYLLLGNGKLSLYLFGMILVGTLVYPEYIGYYIRWFRRGNNIQKFHDIEFKELLGQSVVELRERFTTAYILITLK